MLFPDFIYRIFETVVVATGVLGFVAGVAWFLTEVVVYKNIILRLDFFNVFWRFWIARKDGLLQTLDIGEGDELILSEMVRNSPKFGGSRAKAIEYFLSKGIEAEAKTAAERT